jgi:hypothetical protein
MRIVSGLLICMRIVSGLLVCMRIVCGLLVYMRIVCGLLVCMCMAEYVYTCTYYVCMHVRSMYACVQVICT